MVEAVMGGERSCQIGEECEASGRVGEEPARGAFRDFPYHTDISLIEFSLNILRL